MTSSGTPASLVLHRRVVDRHRPRRRAGSSVHAALGARRQLVAQPDVGERAAHHHLVVAAPGAVGVEVARLDAVLLQVLPRRAVGRDRAGRRDVVGRDAVAEQRQHPRARDVGRAARARSVRLFEERRVADVRGVGVPREPVAGRHRQRPPPLVARRTRRRTAPRTSRRVTDAQHRLLDLRSRRPDVPQVAPACRRVAVPSGSVVRSIVIAPGQRVGHDQRRRGEVVRPHLRLDAPLEVAVAAQHRGDDQVPRLGLAPRPPRAAGRCCRCRSCSRSRRG